MSLAGVVRRKGVAVTFTQTVQAYNEGTHTTTPTTTTVAGVAIHAESDPERFRDLSLTEQAAVTVIFVPDTAGQAPVDGMTASWGGLPYTVRSVQPVGLTDSAVAFSVVLAR